MALSTRVLSRAVKLLAAIAAIFTLQTTAIWAASPTLVAQPVVTGPASIPELARALKNDVNLIYEYVYTNIEYSPTYGVKKGALGTILDGRGNDFDQAALMVALLRQAGYTASYVYGQIELSPAQLTAWLGVPLGDGCAINQILSVAGGIPITLNVTGTPVCSNPLVSADIAHVWVSVTGGSLGTNTYVYDPSFKSYTTTSSGINLATAMGYVQSSFLSAVEAGSTITSTSIQNLNTVVLRNQLAGFTNSLISYIRSNNPTATPKDIVGGRYIQPITQPYTPQTSLSYEKPGDMPQTWTGDIPNQYRTTLEILIGGIDQTYYSDQIYGHRLSIVYDVNSKPVLYLDGLAQGTGSANATTLSYNVDFPFCFLTSGSGSSACSSLGSTYTNVFSFSNTLQATAGYTYAIVNGWDFTGRGMVEFHRKLIRTYRSNGMDPASEPVLGEALNMIGYSWLAQFSAADDLQDRIIGSKVVIQCAIGVAGQVTGPYLDVPGVFVGASSLTSSDTNRATTALFSDAAHSSGFEWSTLGQNITNQKVNAVSTVNILDTANSQNLIVYDANSTTWSTIQPLLSNYSAADLTAIGNYITNGYRVILPQKGNLAQYAWTGVGYLAIKTDPVSGVTQISHLISTTTKGGFPDYYFDPDSYLGSAPITIPAEQNAPDSPYNTATQQTPPPDRTSVEPIDLSSGAYLYDHDDLTIGSSQFPISLTFHRSYNSNNRYVAGPLGLGWSHNFAISTVINSDGLKGLAQDSPIDGAAAIAAAYIAKDLYSDTTKPLAKLMIATLTERWLMDQLINNVVNVTIGSQTEQFVLLPDGSYNAQLGSTDRLSLNSATYQLKLKDGTTLAFNTAGNLSAWRNPAGVTVTFAYNTAAVPQLILVSNGLGHTLTLSYNGLNQLTAVTDETGRSVAYSYDSVGDLTRFTDPSGNVSRFSYALPNGFVTPGLLTQIFYPSLPVDIASTTNTYDSLGRVASQANANNGPGNNTTWNYFFAGYRTEEDDAYGTQHVLYYNPRGKVLFEIQDLAGLDPVTATLYDGLDRVSSVTQPEGGVTSFTYSTANPWANNIASVTRTSKPGSMLSPLTTSYTYDSIYNKPTSITDPLGLLTTMVYDVTTGNLVSFVTDSGSSGHFSALRRFTYNGNGQVLTAIDPLGTLMQFTYDSFGNVTSKTVDCCGTRNINARTSMAYNAVGDVITVVDPNGNIAASTYDANRRPLTMTAPAAPAVVGGIQTANTYDADGHLLQVQQSASGTVLRTTSTRYTLTGKPATTTDANGNVTLYAYDLNDRLISVTDAVGRVTSFGYDALSRRTQVSNSAIQSAPLVQRSYTADGLTASLTFARSNATFDVTNFAYDGFDRLSTTTYPDSTTEVLSYDNDGNVSQRQTRAIQAITFTYDTLNRLSTKAAPSEPTVTYTYDLAGHLIGASDNSSAITAATSASGTLSTATMSYDQVNRPLSFSFTPVAVQTTPTAGSSTFNYAYDLSNRRIGSTATDNSWWSYPTAATAVSYTANSLDQYTAVGSVTPTYDGNGNLTYDGTFTYSYDAESRLTSVTQGGITIATYAYDSQGRRKSKTVGATTTIYVTDAANRAVLDYDGTTGSVLRWYVFGSGPNEVLNQTNVAAGTRATFVPDIQGSIIGSLDSSSGTVTQTGYRSFGESGSTAGTFRYTGARIDAETNGLYDFRARLYSPSLGRFLQPDPLRVNGGTNFYAYTGNDPINGLDPRGLCYPVCTIATGAVVGAITSGTYYLISTPSPSFGGFMASSTEGAIVGGVAGSGAGLVTIGQVGATVSMASQFVSAAADNNLDRYGTTTLQNVVVIVGDAVVGATSSVLGAYGAQLASPLLTSAAERFEASVLANSNLTSGAASFAISSSREIINLTADVANSFVMSTGADFLKSIYSFNSSDSALAGTPQTTGTSAGTNTFPGGNPPVAPPKP